MILSPQQMYIKSIMCSLFKVSLFEFTFKICFSCSPLKFSGSVFHHWNSYSELHSKSIFC